MYEQLIRHWTLDLILEKLLKMEQTHFAFCEDSNSKTLLEAFEAQQSVFFTRLQFQQMASADDELSIFIIKWIDETICDLYLSIRPGRGIL